MVILAGHVTRMEGSRNSYTSSVEKLLDNGQNGDCLDGRIILIYVFLSQTCSTEVKRTFQYYVQIKAV